MTIRVAMVWATRKVKAVLALRESGKLSLSGPGVSKSNGVITLEGENVSKANGIITISS